MRCNEFLPTTKFKSYHDFLKHYSSSKNVIEKKPLSVTSIGNVTKFEISYQEHSSHYDFYNSESLVDKFLFKVKTRIQRSDTDYLVRCGFSLENIQPAIDDYDQPLKSRGIGPLIRFRLNRLMTLFFLILENQYQKE